MGSYNVKVGGVWRPAKAVHAKVSGTWRAAKEVWVKSGGIWRKAWSARTVSIYMSEYTQVNSGLGSEMYDRITFAIQVSDGAIPTAYDWPTLGSASSTATFFGPTYNTGGFTRILTDTVTASVTVGGETYYPTLDFQYTGGDDI